MHLLLIGVAGAAGALARYGVGVAVGVRTFPWATLVINVVGSFLLGLLVATGQARLSADARLALAAGFLGAFTTFSTFGHESVTMVREGRVASAATYVGISVVGGLAASAVGYLSGRLLA